MRNIWHKPRANQIFSKIDKLPSNANDVSLVFSRCCSDAMDGGSVRRARWGDVYNIIYILCIMTCVEQ